MNKHAELAIKALKQMMGDDLTRAKAAFARLTEKEMREPYGQSDCTPQQILERYMLHEAKCLDAIQWLRLIAG